jgi:hypothetical protein
MSVKQGSAAKALNERVGIEDKINWVLGREARVDWLVNRLLQTQHHLYMAAASVREVLQSIEGVWEHGVGRGAITRRKAQEKKGGRRGKQ